jgi:3-hydroxybutyrate dehydrogenase
MKLQNKIAIVTGAASGIGKAIAMTYAREGAKVAIADLNKDAAETCAAEIRATLDQSGKSAQAMSVAMDVTDEAQVNTGVAEVVGAWGGVDVLVSNAGIQIVHPIEEFSYADWKKMLAIHLDGAFLTTKACLPHMYASGRGGSVIYMGSVHSHVASMLKAPYVTAKHGLMGLSKVVAKEGAAHGVRSNVICPGFVRTPLVDKQIPEQAAKFGITEAEVIKNIMLKDTVDGEFTTVQDVAEVALVFAAFPSNALTGQSLIVSHGWAMQ